MDVLSGCPPLRRRRGWRCPTPLLCFADISAGRQTAVLGLFVSLSVTFAQIVHAEQWSRLLHVRMHLPILWLHDPSALFDFRISTFLFPLLAPAFASIPPSLALQPDSDAAWLSAFDVRRRRRRCQIYLPDVRV